MRRWMAVALLAGCTEHGDNPGLTFEYQLSGTITEVDDSPLAIAIGDAFTANLFYAKCTTVADAADAARYRCSLGAGFGVSIGANQFGGDSLSIDIVDRPDGDSIRLQSEGTDETVSWELDDASGTALDGVDFSRVDTITLLDRFEQPIGLTVEGGPLTGTIRGTIDQATLCCF